ncbi:MAG: RNA polymerase sigma factor [Bacteroidota bacterium]
MTTEEYNKTVDAFSDNVFRFALKNTGDTEKAKDIVQETWERLWMKKEDVSYEKVKSYLFTTAYHTIIDQVRREKKKGVYNEAAVRKMSYTTVQPDLKEILDEAVKKLPEIQRTVVLLRDYEGYDYQEIGEITGLSESQVKVYIFRARKFLKEYIGSIETVI